MLLDAVQVESAGLAVTDTVPVPPAAAMLVYVGFRVIVGFRPDCVTLNVIPAIVRLPDRELDDVLATTVYPTVPFPVPEAPDRIDIQDELLVAVHAASPGVAVTETVAFPPELAGVADGGFKLKDAEEPDCVMLNVWPAIVSEPDREFDEVFAATEYPTDPFPVPEAPDVTVTHAALLVAVQVAS